MSNLTERANYLKGLADGLQLNTEKSSTRLLLEVIDLLSDMADEIEALQADHEELSDFVDAIDEDLGLLEEDVADLEDGPDFQPHCKKHPCCREDSDEEDFDRDFADEDEEAEEDSGEDEVTYNCPHCGKEVTLVMDGFDFDEDMPCPECGKPLFPETFEDVDGESAPEEEEKEEKPEEKPADENDEAEDILSEENE